MESSLEAPSNSTFVKSIVVKLKSIGNNIDLAWRFNHQMVLNKKNKVTCDFYLVTSLGGITRAR
jgi:hypothetical protein